MQEPLGQFLCPARKTRRHLGINLASREYSSRPGDGTWGNEDPHIKSLLALVDGPLSAQRVAAEHLAVQCLNVGVVCPGAKPLGRMRVRCLTWHHAGQLRGERLDVIGVVPT
jgi:hypothetical protein